MRINRFLSWAGVASRRKADELIQAGRVRVNDVVLQTMGVTVQPGVDRVAVDGQVIEPPTATLVFLFHKPAGYLVSRRGQGDKPTIYSLLPDNLRRLQTVGRLDFDTDGVLLLTNDGELSRRLQHPRYGIERIYRAETTARPNAEKIRLAREGVDLGDPTPARAEIRRLESRGRENILEIKITEGRKREVKRLLLWADAPVVRLTRTSFAGIQVGQLSPGAWRELEKPELAALRGQVGLADSAGSGPK